MCKARGSVEQFICGLDKVTMAVNPDGSKRDDLEVGFAGFHKLMPYRVQHVLLVSTLYESFILEEEGLLTELITSEYLDMNLSHAPRVSRVSTGHEALKLLGEEPVDLVITMTRLGGDLTVTEFADAVKWRKPDLPVVVLADEPRSIQRAPEIHAGGSIDGVFVWSGDAKILLAIIKLIEDRFNAEPDTKLGDVRVILLVENSVRFYSSYLPLIYTELMKLTQSLMAEGLNRMHRLLRMRARPRILLAENYEEAWELYTKFSANLLGVISDVRFPREGKLDSQAGLVFTRHIREDSPHMPVLLQSSDGSHAGAAGALNANFLNKRSRNLLMHLREFILDNLGFGDFTFRLPDSTVVGRAKDLRELEDVLQTVPVESIAFHARHNHFSNWMMARTEFELASRLRPAQVTDFPTLEGVREYLVRALQQFRDETQSGVITDFSARKFDVTNRFTRIGGGSIGGKARGLAFVNALIRHHDLSRRFDNVKIFVPNSATLGTDVFDEFLEENQLLEFVSQDVPDEVVSARFLEAKIPNHVLSDLTAFLRSVRYPLAVRSSSLLEDSQGRPFAGIYTTYMISNNHSDLAVRLDQLCDAIKRVYASTFFNAAKRYLDATGRHLEEEKMGVLLQEIVGSEHSGRFYPTFAGVARSYNFYPAGEIAPEEGVVAVALGLGKTVVEGGKCLMFSPGHPENLPQFATTKDMLANSQRQFYALDTRHPDRYPMADADANLLLCDLADAEQDGTLAHIGSVYSSENNRVYDGIRRPGPRIVSFAHVLKSQVFPLAEVLSELLELGQEGVAGPVEIEFAVDMSVTPMEFGFLQIRPIIVHEEYESVRLEDVSPDQALCYSERALGNGRISDLTDVVYVKPETFDAGKTREIAGQIGKINETLRTDERCAVFIGPGRWGTADRWLGIPVTWDQIACAQIIVETALENFMVTPSQGTHFFQNLTSLGVGYFSVDPNIKQGFINWSWLAEQNAIGETEFVRHVRLDAPLEVRIDGRSQRGVILKQSSDPLGAIDRNEDGYSS